MSRLLSCGLIILGGALLPVVGGCGPGSSSISGRVTFQGQPLPSGRIVFLCQGGNQPVLTATIVDGNYTIAEAPPGPAQVTIATYQSNYTPVPGMVESPEMPVGQVPSGPYLAIPARYSVPDRSGLTYDILKGSQTKDFDLAP